MSALVTDSEFKRLASGRKCSYEKIIIKDLKSEKNCWNQQSGARVVQAASALCLLPLKPSLADISRE